MIADDFNLKRQGNPHPGSVRIKAEPNDRPRVTNADTGEDIDGVTAVSIDIRANDIVRAKIDLCSFDLDVQAKAEYRVLCPATGDFKAVKRIEFADGEVVDFS